MSKFNANKWYGLDVISLLLGGNANKLRQTGEALEEIAKFMEQINTLREGVNKGIDDAVKYVQNGLDQLNPAKASFEKFANDARNTVTDLKGTGVYFLNLNESTPPLWSYGFRMEEAMSLSKQSDLKSKLIDSQTKINHTDADTKAENILTRQIQIEKNRYDNIRRGNYGGVGRYMQLFNESLDDTSDRSRPILSDRAAVAALFIMFGSSSLGNFFRAYDNFKELIKTFFPNPTDGISSLYDLQVTKTGTDAIDEEYVMLREYVEMGDAVLVKQKKTPPAYAPQPEVLVIIKSKETGEIEEVIPVVLTDTIVTQLKSDKQNSVVTTGLSSAGVEAVLKKSSFQFYVHENNAEMYYDSRDIICLINKSICTIKGLDADKFWHDVRGGISYVTKTSIWEDVKSFVVGKSTVIYDASAPNSLDGSVYLFWKYPRSSFLMTRILAGTTTSWDLVYILRKEIKESDPSNGLEFILSKDSNPVAEQGLDITVKGAFKGLRKSYFTTIPYTEIDEAKAEGIIGYDFAVGAGYTVYSRIFIGEIWYQFPVYMTGIEGSAEFAALKADRIADRKRIFDLIAAQAAKGGEEAQTFYKKTKDSYGDPNTIEVKKVSFSNIEQMRLATAYDLTRSNPPDWIRTPHMMSIFPQIFKALDDVLAIINLLEGYVKDAFSFMGELSDSLKLEADYYLTKITQVAKALSDIIRSLNDLAFGTYALYTTVTDGGIAEVKKILAMSLIGNLEDVPWNGNPNTQIQFSLGPPPFGSDDYVGGYVFLAGGPEFLVELLNGIQADFEIKGYQQSDVTDDFSSNYADMTDAAESNKQDLSAGKNEFETVGTGRELQNLDVAKNVAYLQEALRVLNSGDTGALAGCLANGMICSVAYQNAGAKLAALKNYDGSAITSPGIIAMGEALRSCTLIPSGTSVVGEDALVRNSAMAYAASVLKSTGDRIPSVLSLFNNDTDASLVNDFILTIGQAITDQLTLVPVDESLRGAIVAIDPYDGIDTVDAGSSEGDTYQVGLNVALWYNYDPRVMMSSVYNTPWGVDLYDGLYDMALLDPSEFETALGNDEWEVGLLDQGDFPPV